MKLSRRVFTRWFLSSLFFGVLVNEANNVNVTKDPNVLAREMFTGRLPIVAQNAALSAADDAAGTFSGGRDLPPGFKSGVIMSTGDAAFAKEWTHTQSGLHAVAGNAGDSQLSQLIGDAPTYDAATLTYQFTVPASNTNMVLRFALVSEEGASRTTKGFDDVFALFLDGREIATLRASETELPPDNGGFRESAIRRKGLRTIVRTKVLSLPPNSAHTIKLAIADGGDRQGDSVALINIDGLKEKTSWFPSRQSEPPTIVSRSEGSASVPETNHSGFLLALSVALLAIMARFAGRAGSSAPPS